MKQWIECTKLQKSWAALTQQKKSIDKYWIENSKSYFIILVHIKSKFELLPKKQKKTQES